MSDLERSTIDELLYLGARNISALWAAVDLPWLQDDPTETEYEIIKWIRSLAGQHPLVVIDVIGMPFLATSDNTDVLALRGMFTLAQRGALDTLTAHPMFQDGITDGETTLVAAVSTLYRSPGEMQRVLAPGAASVETLDLGTELTPDLRISVIRTDSQSRPATIEAIRDLVEFVEGVMGLPLPTDHVVIMLNEKAVTGKYAGTNHGYAIGYLPRYELAQGGSEQHRLRQGFVHEIAHYYWGGNEGWIDEGIANVVEYLFGVSNGLSRGQLQPRGDSCEAHDLAMVSDWAPESKDLQRYGCNYYLGQLFFQELLESMGEEAFIASLRELYQLSLEEQQAKRIPGIAAVRRVFSGQADVIDRHWSGQLNATENRPVDEGIYHESHDLVEWDQYPTYANQSVSFKGRLLSDAVLENNRPSSGGRQNFALYAAYEYSQIGNILSPLTNGWVWKPALGGSAVAYNYWLYDEGKTFHVQFPFAEVLGDPSDYVVTVRGFQDAEQVATISENSDILGYARIRTR